MDYKSMSLSLIEKNYERLLLQLKDFRKDKGKKTILWGTGAIAHIMFQYLNKSGKKIDFFCDNNPELIGKQVVSAGEIMCLSPEEVLQMKDVEIIIASTSIDEIKVQIRNSGFQGNIVVPPVDMLVFMSIISSDLEEYSKKAVMDSIADLFDILSDEISRQTIYFKIWGWFAAPEEMKEYTFDYILTPDQYIPDGIIHINREATVVDCGAYTGDTLKFFIEKDMKFSKYIGYELDKNNFDLFHEYIESCEEEMKRKIVAYNLGVGDSQYTASFFSKEYSSLILDCKEKSESNGAFGQIVDLDSHLGNENVSYLKMDIEGFEMAALRGAEKLIRREYPDCAICIYHKATDLWQIPLFLKSCYSKYELYVRHHANCYFDTVCYAIGEEKNEMEK